MEQQAIILHYTTNMHVLLIKSLYVYFLTSIISA